jgi:hypothetical protein
MSQSSRISRSSILEPRYIYVSDALGNSKGVMSQDLELALHYHCNLQREHQRGDFPPKGSFAPMDPKSDLGPRDCAVFPPVVYSYGGRVIYSLTGVNAVNCKAESFTFDIRDFSINRQNLQQSK